MAYTVTNFADNVKIKRRLPTTSTALPNAWFYNALPEAVRFLQKEIPFWYDEQTVATVAGTATYALEAGTIEVLQAYITGSTPMGLVDFETFAQAKSLDTRGEPRRYILLGDSPDAANIQPGIGFHLIPDAAYTVNIWGKKTFQTTLTAMSDSVDIPLDWFDCVAMFLTALSYEYDEDNAMADRWLAKAGERLTQIKAIEEDKVNNAAIARTKPGRVKVVGGVEYEVG
jgi:hypothetical protein